MSDKTTFRFQMNGRTAQAHSVGAEHVGLAMSADGIAVSIVMTVAEAIAACLALTNAINASVKLRPDAFDPVAEAERVRHACGDAPQLPAEDR